MSKSEKVWFLRGVLVTLAVVRHEMTYAQIQKIMRISHRQVGSYLGEARAILQPGEPDLCASIVKSLGTPGCGYGNVAQWVAELEKVRNYYQYGFLALESESESESFT